MKFGKRLKQQIQETLPEWRDKFLSYKELKKLVRSVSSSVPYSDSFAKAEADFVSLLNDEIDKFNAFFMEKEEDFVIRHKELQQRIQRVIELRGPNGAQPCEGDYKEEMSNIRKDTVNFHGEMVLLLNYSNINYIGLAKILKKYDKRTGGLLRSPFIEKVLQQPFFTTDLISKLVKQCESTIDEVFPAEERTTTTTTATCNKISCIEEEEEAAAAAGGAEYNGGEPRAAAAGASLGEGIFRNTVAALLTMKEIRKGSSTYSHFSLPPLNLSPPDRNSSHLTLQRSNLHRPNSPIPITTYSV